MKKDSFEQIDEFLSGNLKGAELEEFREELEKNRELQGKVVLQGEIREALLEKDVDELRLKLQKSRKGKEVVQKPVKRVFYRIAASVALITGLSAVFYIIQHNQTSSETIFKQYFTPYDNLLITRDPSSEDVILNKAMSMYDAGEYEKAIEAFDGLEHKKNPAVHFYLGISHLSIGNIENAISEFTTVIRSDHEILGEVSNWYMALALLKKNDIEGSKEILVQLAKPPNSRFYRSRAKALLDDLD